MSVPSAGCRPNDNSIQPSCRYVSARPEGQRCLVIAAGGTTTSRLRNASLLQSFQSALPQGSTTLQSAAQGPTVLDCIFQDSIHTYWVLDIISWNGYVLAECNAECRITFWVQSKLGELQALPEWMKFVPLPFTSCSAGSPTKIFHNYAMTVPGKLHYCSVGFTHEVSLSDTKHA